ncbi:MAG: shikimate kinase [Clostridia bacterium]
MTNEKYGLIGKTLVHSYSKEIHEALGRYQYQLFSLAEDEMPDFINARDFRGLNVTIPYKKDVIPLCDEVTDLARGIGAVNTLFWKNASGTGSSESISQENKILVGHNTDYEGFLYAASRAGIDFEGKGVLILGTGGTSLMARRAAADQNAAKIYIASRHPETDPPSGSEIQNAGILSTVSYDQLPEIADSIDVIVNTTPVGTFPNNMQQVIRLKDFPACQAVIDVIYNPFKTALLLEAEKLGLKYTNGLPMLVAQATAAAGYFLGTPGAFQKENQRIIKSMKQQMGNIVLIGMPGTGKSLIGKFLAELTGKTLQDTDAKIEEEAKMTIPEIFEKEGEAGFRDRESAICKKLGKERNLIIATGGGAILRPENVDALRQNGTLVHITRSIDKLPTRGRPLSKNIETLKKMEAQRMPLYKSAADITFRNNYTCSRKKLRQRVNTYILEKL